MGSAIMARLTILFITFLFLYNSHLPAQAIHYKTYNDSSHGFSFEIPNYWAIKYDKDQDQIICIPITNTQKDIYRDCFEGIVFRIDFFNFDLDSTLSNQGYSKVGNIYYTRDRVNDSVVSINIKGKNWTGIYHNNICGISCIDNGFHAAGGECQFIYFSDGRLTVCINTNGRAFEDAILKRIMNSFRFISK